jgi:hypothetical protein
MQDFTDVGLKNERWKYEDMVRLHLDR